MDGTCSLRKLTGNDPSSMDTTNRKLLSLVNIVKTIRRNNLALYVSFDHVANKHWMQTHIEAYTRGQGRKAH